MHVTILGEIQVTCDSLQRYPMCRHALPGQSPPAGHRLKYEPQYAPTKIFWSRLEPLSGHCSNSCCIAYGQHFVTGPCRISTLSPCLLGMAEKSIVRQQLVSQQEQGQPALALLGKEGLDASLRGCVGRCLPLASFALGRWGFCGRTHTLPCRP